METIAIDQAFILSVLRANRDRLRTEFGIERIGLYGSFARNEQTDKSDIDLIYHLLPDARLSWTEKERLYRILRRKLHRKMDLVDDNVMSPIIKYYVRKDVIYA
ncbi:nucleotidyltransferase family protein [Spirosoma rhododendri]|uniref:Polymerase beta nucleotidyltransferase domain-containing protein n=1 Tax=Spirosoma rhododendri TaxID=2728024 RepID=A0A7L5DQ97_9BACT|nr:nucleotidyltransferase domain-containing protein [Spirosoma rhododendri]QJD78217.1 hypothetical protein HH216_07105 [Spirosoma rhododendri]